MWRFGPGYLGACIVGVALLGGLLLGSIANVDTHTENTTAYEYKTDITGLFDVSQDPQFIDFNPASNYTGYTNTVADYSDPSGISYVNTNIANNYRILTEQPHVQAGPSGTVNNNTSLPQYTFTYEDAPADVRIVLSANGPEITYNSGLRSGYITGFKGATVYDWVVSLFGDLSQYSEITITATPSSYTAPSTRAMIGSVYWWASGGYYDISNDLYGTTARTFTIDPVNMTYSYTVGQFITTRSLYSTYLFYGNGTQYDTQIVSQNTVNHNTVGTELSFTYTSTYTTIGAYNYMIPADGVQNSTIGGATVWDNDQGATNYDNYAVRFLFGPNFNTGTGQFDPINQISQHDTALTIAKTGGGQDTFTLKNNNQGGGLAGWKTWLNGSYTALGDFPAVLISIEKSPYNTDGKTIKAYGVTSFTDYQTIEIDPAPLATWAGSDYDLDNITITNIPNGDSNPINVSWSVYGTTVFMNTYNAVLSNPSINLANYWPDMTSYRFALKNIALYGDSITINGVNYPVTNQKITIGDKSYNLKNCYISYSREGDTSITFNDVNKTVDLGATVSKVLSFYGNWGFSMGLYEGVQSSKEVYDWDISLFGDGLNTCILIALGLLAVGALVCIYFKVGLKFTDKAVLGAGALILVMLLVV